MACCGVSPLLRQFILVARWPKIAAAEQMVGRGDHPAQPYVLLSQPSLFDPSRAPAGKHTAWAYCHVPNGSTVDMTAQIEACKLNDLPPVLASIF